MIYRPDVSLRLGAFHRCQLATGLSEGSVGGIGFHGRAEGSVLCNASRSLAVHQNVFPMLTQRGGNGDNGRDFHTIPGSFFSKVWDGLWALYLCLSP